MCMPLPLSQGIGLGMKVARYPSALATALDKVTYIITGDVYHGDRNSFDNPCVIVRKKVFAAIPAIKIIKREKLNRNSPRYAFLIEEANRVFREVVRNVACEKGFDLVVERGGIKADNGGRVPDITRDVIRAIPKS